MSTQKFDTTQIPGIVEIGLIIKNPHYKLHL